MRLSSVLRSYPVPTLADTIRSAAVYLARFQSLEGSLRGQYDGPLFLIPAFVFAHYATRRPIDSQRSHGLIDSILRCQNEDGGFPLHIEGDSYLFTTVLNYVALRLLGVSNDASVAKRARSWIKEHGDALHMPSWGKYWLAILHLYSWHGVNPVLPEAMLLPRWLPFHPCRIWCHARAIYLSVSYLYGKRWQIPDDQLLADIRSEIYQRPYTKAEFVRARNFVAATDLRVPRGKWLRIVNAILCQVERWIPERVRKHALSLSLDHIHHGQADTSYLDIGPVNKTLNAVACYANDPVGPHTRKALEALDAYLFEGESGLVVQAYNSSELWDTAFSIRALSGAQPALAFAKFIEAAYRYVDVNQVLEDSPQRVKYFRDSSRGGWPFSNAAHGWPIADCTAEALMAVLETRARIASPISADRLMMAIDLILQWQNPDGGWPTYERCRGWRVLEWLNPSEMFRGIMIDQSCVEATSAALQALALSREALRDSLGARRLSDIDSALRWGGHYIRQAQRPDGSWKGSWGICFLYGTWFGVWGLVASGVPTKDAAIVRAVRFVKSKQRADGGWSESYRSCTEDAYIEHSQGTQPVMTAWALLTLLGGGGCEMDPAVRRGIRWLVDHQRPDGDWRQVGMTGVFNQTCMLNYRFYRNYFPIWALVLFQRRLTSNA